jgi:hypothetical protein
MTQWGRDAHGKLYAMPVRDVAQGHSGSKKVPYVCKGCNNGWMSRMESRTRPILTPLIQGLPHSISTFDQQYLATWIAKTVMVAEYAHPDHVAVPDRDRLHLLGELAPPDHWRIWVADYRGYVWRNLAIYHHLGRLAPPKGLESTDSADTHFTSIGMGHLFIQVVATTSGANFAFEDSATTPFRRIWPRIGVIMSWPPSNALFDQEANHVSKSFSRIAGLPHD